MLRLKDNNCPLGDKCGDVLLVHEEITYEIKSGKDGYVLKDKGKVLSRKSLKHTCPACGEEFKMIPYNPRLWDARRDK